MGWTAQPLGVIARRGDVRDFEAIAEFCRDRGVETIIAGLPLDAEGTEGPQARKVHAFMQRLDRFLREHEIRATIEFQDERYSTATASARLIEANVSRARRRKVIDKMAAVAILEEYLAVHELPADRNEEDER
jgi:putative Holliday junction resolvase